MKRWDDGLNSKDRFFLFKILKGRYSSAFYNSLKTAQKKDGYAINYSLNDFLTYIVNQTNFMGFYSEWKKTGLKSTSGDKPLIIREDFDKPNTLDNILVVQKKDLWKHRNLSKDKTRLKTMRKKSREDWIKTQRGMLSKKKRAIKDSNPYFDMTLNQFQVWCAKNTNLDKQYKVWQHNGFSKKTQPYTCRTIDGIVFVKDRNEWYRRKKEYNNTLKLIWAEAVCSQNNK